MPNTKYNRLYPHPFMSSADWLADCGFWLSLDMEMRPQVGVWENISWIPGYPHWVFKRNLPTIGPIHRIPTPSDLPIIKLLEIKQKIAELNIIWKNYE